MSLKEACSKALAIIAAGREEHPMLQGHESLLDPKAAGCSGKPSKARGVAARAEGYSKHEPSWRAQAPGAAAERPFTNGIVAGGFHAKK